MGSELQTMYTQLVEKLEYQNREAAEHDHALKKGVWRIKDELGEKIASNTALFKMMVKLQKGIIALLVINFGANAENLSVILRLLT